MISAASKWGAAISARCIITTAPTAKFGATMPPMFFSLHAVCSLSTSEVESPVVPITGEAPAATAARALCRASAGAVKSTSARGLFWCRNSARLSPRVTPPTNSKSGSDWKAAASTEPTLPRYPATATRMAPAISLQSRLVSAWTPVSTSTVPAPAVPPSETALARSRRWRGKRDRHRLLADLLFDRLALRGELFDRGLPAQVEPALAVDLDRLDHDLVADVADLFHPLHAVVGELGDVHEAVLAGKHLDKGAERHDADDLSLVDPAHLDLVGQALDPVDRLLAAFLVDRGDEDAAVVLDVDLRAGLLGDPADHRAPLADDVADLVGVDQDGRDPRRKRAHLGARPRQDGEHLVEHEQARLAGLLEGLGHDLVGQAFDLDVHLQGGDALARPRHLEVHVPEGVLDALDVGEDRELALAGDKSHRDARDGRLDRHARVHQRKRRAAHGGHRRRAVRAQDLGDEPDRVRPVLDRRDDRQHGPLGARTVSGLAPPLTAQRPRR